MLSVIIATDGAEQPAVATLSSLVAGAASGIVRDVVLVDGAASDTIARVADVAGCTYLAAPGPRGAALAKGAAQARGAWLLFLSAGAMLDPSWIDEAAQFMQNVALSGSLRVGIFTQARSPYADFGWRDWLTAASRLLRSSSSTASLLIAREHYDRLGGHPTDARAPEAKLLSRLGRAKVRLRSRLVML